MLFNIVLATIIVGLVSFIGIVVIFNDKKNPRVIKALISLSAGSLLAVAFLDLLPEAIENSSASPGFLLGVTLLSIIIFFVFERAIHWHHCHCEEHGIPASKEKKSLIYINLTGDAIHNLIDGFLIAAAFMIDAKLGVVVTLAVILHEIPQEIADFGVLLYAGLSRVKALTYNFFIALTAIGGALLFYFFGSSFESAIPIMAAFAAGNFIYLATADIIPELHHESKTKNIVANSIWLIVGALVIFLFGRLVPGV